MNMKKVMVCAVGLTFSAGMALNAQVRQQPQQQQQQNPQMQMQQQNAPDVDVSDEELQQFVDVAMKVQEMQGQSEEKMMGVLEEEGLDVQTFQKIQQSQAQGQAPEGVSEDDVQSFESASQKIQEIQQKDQEKMMETINSSEIDMQRFQEIQMAFQSDPELQQRAREMME